MTVPTKCRLCSAINSSHFKAVWETAVQSSDKTSPVHFRKFVGSRRLRVCLYVTVQMITRAALSAWAQGLEKHKKVKCKTVRYLMPGSTGGTRCYLYVGNGLSHLRAQIKDLLFFSFSLSYHHWSFHYLVHTLSPQWHSSSSTGRCITTKQLISCHLIYPLTPILIGPYHHKHIIEF